VAVGLVPLGSTEHSEKTQRNLRSAPFGKINIVLAIVRMATKILSPSVRRFQSICEVSTSS
jgi:hypothetical protein